MIKPVGGVDPVLIYSAPAYNAPGRQVLIANTDELNPAYYAEDLTLVNGQASTIPPLGSVGLDGQTDVWASSLQPGTTIDLDVIPGGQQWAASPAQIAEQISAAGIPPIDNPQALPDSPVFNQTIAAGGTYTSPRMTVKQFVSWFGKLFCTATASGLGTNPFCQIELQWSVASDGFDPLRIEDWVVPSTPFNFTYNYVNELQGLIIGDTLTLIVTNYDSQPVNLTYGLFGSYRTRLRSIFRGNYFAVPAPGSGLGTDDIVLAASLGGIANGGVSPAALMNLWEGPVTVSAEFPLTGAPTGPLVVEITPQPVAGPGALSGSGQYTLQAVSVGGGANLMVIPPTTVILPRRVCMLAVSNSSGFATGAASNVLVTAQVQPE